ncbi:MAG TPA: SIS domain-containing protein [Candidatus Limnocylindrales bacterium]|jgi:glucosamine--fructose-6-phosphate aminotransferase (isomerizing)
MTTTFDPTAPLPAPPDPWWSSTLPSPRPGPPFHMTDMIAAEPWLARRILGKQLTADSPAASLAVAVRAAAAGREPIVVTGCGTSEHAALGIAAMLAEALGGRAARLVAAAQAFEEALAPQPDGLLIAVSHEGGSAATNASIEAARAAGARTALITAGPASPGAQLADVVVTTDEMDEGWCHTIGYVAPLVAGVAVAAHVTGRTIDPDAVGDLLGAGGSDTASAEAMAAALAQAKQILVIASGVDRGSARELVLKIEEGSWVPSAMRDLETFLHGHLPATDESTGLVLILTERDHRDERVKRARQALEAAGIVGIRVGAILAEPAADAIAPDLTPIGRMVVPDDTSLPQSVAGLLAGATALQVLSERIARARGTNPDPIRHDDPRYAAAAAAIEG